MVKLSNKGLLGIAVGLSLVTTMLVYNYLQGATTKQAPQEGVSVIVAKVDITPKTKITAAMVQEMKVPTEYLQPGAMLEAKTVVGVVVREHILAGEQVTERRLVFEGKAVGFTGIIPRDKRAVTVAVTEVTGVAGFIKAGNYVDIIATFDAGTVGDNVSQIVLQNVLVLAVNRDTEAGITETAAKDPKEANKTMTVTLAVTPEEASQLTLTDEKGKIRLALRPYMPLNGAVITTVVTPKDLVGTHSSPAQDNMPGNKERVAPPAYPLLQEQPMEKNKPSAGGTGIQVIRGTKTDSVPLN